MEQEYQFQTEITEPPKPSKFWPTVNRVLTLLLIVAVIAVVGRGIARGLTPPVAKEAAAQAKAAVTSGIVPAKAANQSGKPMTMRDLRKQEKPFWQKLLSPATPKKSAPATKAKKRG
ncbi:MAG: hypothetical protein ACYC63_06265 [Armatimonadota bacterium]